MAEDHPIYLRGVRDALDAHPQIELLAEATDGDTALSMVRKLRPDVALLDVKMPGRDGLQVLRELRADESRVVLISAYGDAQMAYEALAAGAYGYLSKDADDDEICGTLIAAARGGTVVSPALRGQVLAQIRTNSGDPPRSHAPLSTREQEILSRVARGEHGAQIGRALHLSPATVKTYVSRACVKLGVTGRAAASAEAVRRGLVE